MAATATVELDVPRSAVGALAGLAFSLCFLVGVAMLNTPKAATDAELLAWWSDSGHQTTAVVSMYLFVLAGLCFLVFLVKLRSRLLAAEGGADELSALVVASGVAFVSMLFVAAAARGLIGFAVKSPSADEPLPGADVLRYVPLFGRAVTGTGALLAAAVTMGATSLLIVRTAVFGRWLAWVGGLATLVVVVAAALLSAVYVIPALLVWTVAASAAMTRSASDRAA